MTLLLQICASDAESDTAGQNPAVARCLAAFTQSYHAAIERKNDAYDARSKAKIAFRRALPPLIGRKNIRNFIAAVAYGMAVELISSGEGMRLLTAARAAATVQDQRSHHKARQNAPQSAPKGRKSAPLSPENQPEMTENKVDTPIN